MHCQLISLHILYIYINTIKDNIAFKWLTHSTLCFLKNMIICKFLKLPPIELAMKIVNFLKQENQIMKVEVVKPGFVNIFFIILFGKTNYVSI